MKLFLDSANKSALEKWGYLLDDITTNPSTLAKEGNDPTKHILELCALMKGKEINVEVTEKDPEKLYLQAKKIAALHNTIIVKIPCHSDYYPIIIKLVREKIKVNITLVFTVVQALLMSKFGVYYISPFVGRWDDIDVDGISLLYELRTMIDHYDYTTQILAASIRHTRHFHGAIMAGADVVTVSPSILEKAVTHPLTDQGIEIFDKDWKKIGPVTFPA